MNKRLFMFVAEVFWSMATLKDIAEATGFSVSVVSRTLNPAPDAHARVSQKTREKIVDTAKRIGFRRNISAEFLKRGKAASLGVFLPEYSNNLIADLVMGLSDEATRIGFPLDLYFGLTVESYDRFFRRATDVSNSGIITYPYTLLENRSVAEKIFRFRELHGAVVILNSEKEMGGIPIVHIDDAYGAKRVAEHLLARDCRTFATVPYFKTRTEIFIETIARRGFVVPTLNMDSTREFIKECANAEHVLPAGIFAATDGCAVEVMKIARRAGLRIGEDLLLVGYDDQCLTSLLDPGLTTVRQPFREAGRIAVRKLVNMIYGKEEKSEILLPELIVRGSG